MDPGCLAGRFGNPKRSNFPLEGSNAVSQSVRIGTSLFRGSSADKMNAKLLEITLMLNTGKLVRWGFAADTDPVAVIPLQGLDPRILLCAACNEGEGIGTGD